MIITWFSINPLTFFRSLSTSPLLWIKISNHIIIIIIYVRCISWQVSVSFINFSFFSSYRKTFTNSFITFTHTRVILTWNLLKNQRLKLNKENFYNRKECVIVFCCWNTRNPSIMIIIINNFWSKYSKSFFLLFLSFCFFFSAAATLSY